MIEESIIAVIVIILAFLIIFSILKSMIKAALIVFVMVILFRFGWVYNSTDLKETMWFDTIIKSEYQDDFYLKYDKYRTKTKKDEVIDTEEVDNQIKDKINEYLLKENK